MKVSVVMATHDRPDGLRTALAALFRQTLPRADFEIVVVDDGSGPETAAVLAEHAGVRVIRRDRSGGPAAARNDGWRAAHAPYVAFTDDDCTATPGWLEALLAAAAPDRIVQGPTLPDPEAGPLDHFCHTLEVRALGPWWETANILYPRSVVEAVGGFEEDAYSGPGGEDTDLGWRAIEHGCEPVWAPQAVMHHAVTRLSAREKLRLAWRWDETMLVFRRHPHLRAHLTAKVFWMPNHWWLVRALVALALPRRLWWVRWWLAAPYMLRLGTLRPDVVAVLVANDAVEMTACMRGALRYRVPVL